MQPKQERIGLFKPEMDAVIMARIPRKPRRKVVPRMPMDRISEAAQKMGLTGKVLRRALLIRDRAPHATKTQLLRMLKLLEAMPVKDPLHMYLTNSIADRAMELNFHERHKRQEENLGLTHIIIETAKERHVPNDKLVLLQEGLHQIMHARRSEEIMEIGDRLPLNDFPDSVNQKLFEFLFRRFNQLNPKKK